MKGMLCIIKMIRNENILLHTVILLTGIRSITLNIITNSLKSKSGRFSDNSMLAGYY